MADRSAAKSSAATYAQGKMSAEDVRNKFGFSYNEEHAKNSGGYSKYGGRDDGAIYNQKTGEYVGTIDNFTKRGEDDAKGIDQFEVIQDHELKHGFRSSKRTDWDSMNDVAGAVQNLLGENQAAPAAAEPEKDTSQPASKTLTEAQSYVEAADDFRVSGGAVNQMAGDLGARDKFMENYKFNVKKRMEPGVANKTGNDKLNATVPENVLGKPSDYATSRTQEREDLTDSFAQKNLKLSNIATDLVGKNAGFQSV